MSLLPLLNVHMCLRTIITALQTSPKLLQSSLQKEDLGTSACVKNPCGWYVIEMFSAAVCQRSSIIITILGELPQILCVLQNCFISFDSSLKGKKARKETFISLVLLEGPV